MSTTSSKPENNAAVVLL